MPTLRDIGLFVVAFFLPPLAVCESEGPRRSCRRPTLLSLALSLPTVIQKSACDMDVFINILLTLLGWIPGAFWGADSRSRCPHTGLSPHLPPPPSALEPGIIHAFYVILKTPG